MRISARGWLRDRKNEARDAGGPPAGTRRAGRKPGRYNKRKRKTGFIQKPRSARVVIRGGNVNNGTNGGAGYVNANNGLTNANANIGARLAE